MQHSVLSTLDHSAAHWITVQHTGSQCSTLDHSAAHWITVQHTGSQCSTLDHSAAHWITVQHTGSQCSTLDHSAAHWITQTKCTTSGQCNTRPVLGRVPRITSGGSLLRLMFQNFLETIQSSFSTKIKPTLL